MHLPPPLKTALDDALASISPKKMTSLAQSLSHRYRKRNTEHEIFVRTPEEALAYAAFRVPATFAAVASALGQVQQCLPRWEPKTMLDVGAGPGTASWAAWTMWPELKHFDLIEREEAMISLGQRLVAHAGESPLTKATWYPSDLTHLPSSLGQDTTYDLVVASYVLGELPSESRDAICRKLWDLTEGTLVLIDPGTTAGFATIREMREQLISLGATIVAPCPHDGPCPIEDPDWCHFSQRVQRSRLHRQVKAGELSYEDEKFSFVAFSRMSTTTVAARVLRHPDYRKGHVRLKLCTADGIKSAVVTRKSGDRYRVARKLGWGSAISTLEEIGEDQT